MDTRTGDIYEAKEGESFESAAKRLGLPEGALKPIARSLTVKEEFERQIRKYAPCGCGSGKKFKFCCYRPCVAFGVRVPKV